MVFEILGALCGWPWPFSCCLLGWPLFAGMAPPQPGTAWSVDCQSLGKHLSSHCLLVSLYLPLHSSFVPTPSGSVPVDDAQEIANE